MPEIGDEGMPVYGPPTPAWLHPGAPASIPAEPEQADGVVALACMMRTPVDPQSEIKGTIYDIEGIAPGFLRERRSWEDRIPTEEDEAGTSGGGAIDETGTWKTMDDDGRFPSFIDLFLRLGGSLETVHELIRGVKARAEEEMENWCPDRIRIRASTDPFEPNNFWMIGRRPKSGSILSSFTSGRSMWWGSCPTLSTMGSVRLTL